MQKDDGEMKRLLSILITAAALLSCTDEGRTNPGTFTADETIRLEIDGSVVFAYREADCQLACNPVRGEFRAHTDTMLDYFVVTLDHIPETEGDKVTASVRWSTLDGERGRNEITLDTKRIKGETIWLCDETRRTAAVVRRLEVQ